MGGGGGGRAPAAPPPVDYSAAMMASSDNNKTIAMGQIMAQQFAMQQASMDRQMQTAANLELGIEKLDTKLQLAKYNFIIMEQEEEDRHLEKMTEIGADVDAARAERAAAGTVDTTDFLNNDGGSYTPGAPGGAFDRASSYANENRIDFNEQMNGLRESDRQQSARNSDALNNHEANRHQENSQYLDQNSPYGDADGDGVANVNDDDVPERFGR